MCRWIAYSGKPIYIDTLVTKPARSLIDQSLNSRMSFKADGTALPTNGDGFGMGWYNPDRAEPGIFKVPDPAWSNENINELCSHIRSPLFMAHIRAASTGAIQRTNAHPFKYGNWLFQHNGYIGHFEKIRRDLQFDISPELYPYLRGSTDSETFFLLALTYGLIQHPKQALERTIARVTQACDAQKIPVECVLSCALSDGVHLYTLRYATGEHCHSQYYSTHADCMKELNSGEAETMPAHSVVVVSEPLDQSMEHWKEMPVNSFATIAHGKVTVEELTIK
jgi:glutamine amidotransferase